MTVLRRGALGAEGEGRWRAERDGGCNGERWRVCLRVTRAVTTLIGVQRVDRNIACASIALGDARAPARIRGSVGRNQNVLPAPCRTPARPGPWLRCSRRVHAPILASRPVAWAPCSICWSADCWAPGTRATSWQHSTSTRRPPTARCRCGPSKSHSRSCRAPRDPRPPMRSR